MSATDKTSLTDRSIAGFFHLGCSQVILAVVRLASIAVLARLIAPQDFGTTQAAMIVVALGEGFAHLGLGAALVQATTIRDGDAVSALVFALLWGCVTALCIGLGAQPVADVFHMPPAANVLAVLAISVPVNAVATVACALLQRDLKYRSIATVEVGSYALGFGFVGVALAFRQWGCWALVAAAMTHFFLRSAGFCALVIPSLRGRPSWEGCRRLLRFGGGFSLAGTLNQLALRGDQIIIGRYLGNHLLGIYSRAYGVMNLSVSVLGRVLDLVAFSSMSRKQSQLGALALAYQRSLAIVAVVMMPFSALAVVLGPEVILLLLGPEWEEAIVPFQILAVGVFFRVAYKLNGALARSLGRVYGIARRQALYVLLIAAGVWGGHFWGLRGVSAGVVLAVVGHYVSLSSLTIQLLPDVDWQRIARAMLPGVTLAAGVTTVASAVARTARYFQCPGVVVCVATCLSSALFVVGLVHWYPRCVGQHGNWMMERIAHRFIPAWARWVHPLPR